MCSVLCYHNACYDTSLATFVILCYCGFHMPVCLYVCMFACLRVCMHACMHACGYICTAILQTYSSQTNILRVKIPGALPVFQGFHPFELRSWSSRTRKDAGRWYETQACIHMSVCLYVRTSVGIRRKRTSVGHSTIHCKHSCEAMFASNIAAKMYIYIYIYTYTYYTYISMYI